MYKGLSYIRCLVNRGGAPHYSCFAPRSGDILNGVSGPEELPILSDLSLLSKRQFVIRSFGAKVSL